MDEILKLLEESLSIELVRMIISNPKDKEQGHKIKIRPVKIKEDILFQASVYKEDKVYHTNYEKELLKEEIISWLTKSYRQMEVETVSLRSTVLLSKKGKVTIKSKRLESAKEKIDLEHNREKRYLLKEGQPIGFLEDLGVMTGEGKIIKGKNDKFKQINRFLEFIEDIVPQLPREREITIIDFGCGKSYLTFAMYYYLKELKGYDINVIGLDLKKDVIIKCNQLKEKYGYEKLGFYQGDIASFQELQQVDMVVSLHACDTATDYALEKAIRWGAKVILSVPCCQHELNRQINNEMLEPILKYGILKERLSALVTDGLRAELLEVNGYQVQLLEFIDMEHTPKNILIRAVRDKQETNKGEQEKKLRECEEFLGANLTLEKLLTKGREGI